MNPVAGPEEQRDAVLRSVAGRREELIELAAELIRARSLVGQEQEAQQIVADHLRASGFSVARIQPDAAAALADDRAGYPGRSYEGRSSVVGVLEGSGSGLSLHLSGHIAVVPVDDHEAWEHDPWAGEVADGKLWGRGAADMKGGLAAYLIAARSVVEACPELAGKLIFSSVIEEECGGNGMWSVLRAGYDADATLLGEPTRLTLTRAGTGVVWPRLTARGPSMHAARVNRDGPFDQLCRAVAALRGLEAELNRPPVDPLFGAVSDWPYGLTIGMIEGGVWPASAPSALVVRARQGFGRGSTPAQIQAEIRRRVAVAAPAVEVEFDAFRAHAYCHDHTGPLPEALGSAHAAVLGTSLETSVFTATTDARFVTGPCVCYGPVGAGYHGTDEWVDLDSLSKTAAVIALTAARWLTR